MMTLDISSPVNWEHPDNASLRLCLLPHPAFAGGPFWMDVTGLNNQSVGQFGFASAKPVWRGNRLLVGGGNFISTPLTNFSSAGTVIWDVVLFGAFNDGAFCGFWGQSNGVSAPYFDAQKYVDNNFYVGWSGVSGDQRVVVAATSKSFPTGKPVRYAFTWVPGGASKLYADGVLLGTNGGTTSTTNIGIAFNYGLQGLVYTSFVSGMLGELRIYSSALDANALERDFVWGLNQKTDPRLKFVSDRFWSIPAPSASPDVYMPAFATSFWGVP